MAFNKILEKYRKISFSEKDKGDRFEQLMQVYLQTDPQYSYLFKKVWLWKEFPYRHELGGQDVGIDLVALTNDGEYWAIQCKCYKEESSIDKPTVDTFLSTSGRKFKDEKQKTISFSNRLWISTTNKWSSHAEESIRNQTPSVTRITLHNLQSASVDWDKIDKGMSGEAARVPMKKIRHHQKEALEKTHEYFKTADRGKLIMACGTGKTYLSLHIAEHETKGKGLILFLVPSIALIGQALHEWFADAKEPINAICICSDPKVSRKKSKNEDIDNFSVVDLPLPASTDVKEIVKQFENLKAKPKKGLTVVFSTYQSIDVIAKAQKELSKQSDVYGEFDLIICDEAHRTTGVTLSENDPSAFVKVHDNDLIKAKKRLYMTATPRLYSDDTKGKAAEANAVLCSMDNVELFGEEIYRIGFGEAVEKGLLSDYKVLILTLSDKDVPPDIQKMIADEQCEISSDDASKLIGCVNALSKKILGDQGIIKSTDPDPMRRAVAYCQNISVSKKITRSFNATSKVYVDSLPEKQKEQLVTVASKHMDGTMTSPERDELLDWLKADAEDSNESRILTNVRCLSEGVDVPALDAVMFLSARNSQVDVVQSVGRVMRKAPGKKYGYIIIPVVVPSDVEAHDALTDNKRYKIVWSVLNALRAHDDRFNATVNKIDLNKRIPKQILVGRPEYTFDEGTPIAVNAENENKKDAMIGQQLAMEFLQLQKLVFARMVVKVGNRRYWEQWASDVAEIAEKQVTRLNRLIKEEGPHQKAFNDFVNSLRENINPSISDQEAVEMLSQHVITKPVFEALFEDYSFIKNNAVSHSMQAMLDLLEAQAIEKDTETLQKFYDSVKLRASGIDNAEGKQRIIVELYDKFFKNAFPETVDKLGIVFTPVEVVDFIIHSVNDVLKKEFGRSISDENIHVLDPFTGTGTFITRLLQSGLIKNKDLKRKYDHEIHANEIVLLAYYIAAINIENAYHDAVSAKRYNEFDGICLTDTFQLGEDDKDQQKFKEIFPENIDQIKSQKKAPIRVIIGNPPYSVGQQSANDNAQNLKYEHLDDRISETYAKETKATNKNSLYDSYIRAFRWSSDRLDENEGGVLAFVTNGAWIDGNSQDGFRKCLEKEFDSIYVFNLRGNARTSGEQRRKEAGNVFKEGSRTPISITLLIKNPDKKTKKATINYRDIGDYLSHEDKLAIVRDFGSVSNAEMDWKILKPNEHGDWINQRSESFINFIPVEPDKKFNIKSQTYFTLNSMGVGSSRDAWVYNFSIQSVKNNMERMVTFYNKQVNDYKISKNVDIKDFIETDTKKISWSSSLIPKIEKGEHAIFEEEKVYSALYRPFVKQYIYYGDKMIHRRGQTDNLFPKASSENIVICISPSQNDGIAVLMTNKIADLHFNGDTQCFPLYYYEEGEKAQSSLFDVASDSKYTRRDAISDFIYERAKMQYGKSVTKEDIFYYVYGILHSQNYRKEFANDLKKKLPHIPLVEAPKEFWAFNKAGRRLADLHINYEAVPAYKGVIVKGEDSNLFKAEKMRFPKKDQKDIIIFNSKITISDIPPEAYEYVVNGKSAIEWIMDRYQVKVDKASGIKNDPNDWAEDVGNPRYILDLLLSIINVSVQTVEIVNKLPKLDLSGSGSNDPEILYLEASKYKDLKTKEKKTKFWESKSQEELALIGKGLDEYREGQSYPTEVEEFIKDFMSLTKDKPPSPQSKHSA
jgi:predicted helicase